MRDLLAETRQLIERCARHFPRGAIAWSGGKDSMVLLHLLRSEGLNLPLLFFREPWQPGKYVFHDQVIRDWNLLVYSWHPAESAFQQVEAEFEVQNLYRINDNNITCPTGIVPPAEDLPWACALDIARRPKQAGLILDGLEAIWIGHKRCDSDPILGGDAGTRVQARAGEAGMHLLFPLRDWSHADIWAYIESHDVPYDVERYEKADGVWRERLEQRHNADYVHACTRCVDRRPDAARFVECPKLGATIENMAHRVPWAEPQHLSYMRD